jgi:hypothetical protein
LDGASKALEQGYHLVRQIWLMMSVVGLFLG